MSLNDEAGSTIWDCGLVLAHYLIKQHEMGEVCMDTAHTSPAGAQNRSCAAPSKLRVPGYELADQAVAIGCLLLHMTHQSAKAASKAARYALCDVRRQVLRVWTTCD
jgi:hypothetical protein